MTESPQNLLIVFILTACACVGYAMAVRWLRNNEPDHGLTPALVGGGNLILVVAVYFAAGIEAAAVLLGLNLVAGLPMGVEFYTWRAGQRKAKKF